MDRPKAWTTTDLIRLFEHLIEANSPLVSHPEFRRHLNRNENLYANQVIRRANGNIAYRSVDFDVPEAMPDGEFWSKIDSIPCADLIQDNAAVAIFRMAEKLKLLN